MLFPFHDDNPTRIWPVLTVAIIVINVVVFFWTAQLEDHQRRLLIADYAFVPARLAQLTDDQLKIRFDLYPDADELIQQGRNVPRGLGRFKEFKPDKADIITSLFTSLFLHGSVMHLVGNMWFFWIFGNNIEDRLGHIGFLLFYLIGGVFASVCHWLLGGAGNLPVIGASGAVAVTLGAYAVLYPLAKVRTIVFIIIFFTIIELPALVVLGLWFAAQLLQGLGALQQLQINGGVAWWAHIGGFLFGSLLMPLVSMGTPEPGDDWRAEADRQFDFERMMRSD